MGAGDVDEVCVDPRQSQESLQHYFFLRKTANETQSVDNSSEPVRAVGGVGRGRILEHLQDMDEEMSYLVGKEAVQR